MTDRYVVDGRSRRFHTSEVALKRSAGGSCGREITGMCLPPGAECPPEDLVAKEFADAFASSLRWAQELNRWFIWNGKFWEIDRTVKVMDLARRFCRETTNGERQLSRTMLQAKYIAAVERLARSDRKIAAVPEQFDANEFLFNTPAATFDLVTGESREHSQSDYITKCTLHSPADGCPRWMKFLNQITDGDDDLQAYLKRLAGYCLTGSVREHALFFIYGAGANGKTTFLESLAWALGHYSRVASAEIFAASSRERHPTEIAALRGARMVIASETEQGQSWDESRIKKLTGGDQVSARFMRGDFFTFQPTFKIVIAGNHKPQLRNVDEAMRRRVHLIPLVKSVPLAERDSELPMKLRSEAGGILRWAMDGCVDWARFGLMPPALVSETTNEYFSTQDSLACWIADRCEVNPNLRDVPAKLFSSWKNWAEAAGEYIGSQRVFGDRLDAAGYVRRKSHGTRFHEGIAVRQFDPTH